MSTGTLTAVHDDDLSAFLKSLGLFADVEAGRMHCWFCDMVIRMSNLRAVFPDSGTVLLSCSKPECIKQLVRYINER